MKHHGSDVCTAVYTLRTLLMQTQEKFAEQMKVATVTVVRWEGGRQPKGRYLARLARLASTRTYDELEKIFQRELDKELR